MSYQFDKGGSFVLGTRLGAYLEFLTSQGDWRQVLSALVITFPRDGSQVLEEDSLAS